jgi:phosphopantetheinyl transferase (holo-ACP synthase)
LIGNDIIDLSLAKIESNWHRRGFLEKLFTENEQKLISAAPNPFVIVWKFWSMKEAAYKVYTQQDKQRFFAPKKFDCLLISENKGLVNFKNQIFYTSTIVTRSYIFTLASVEKEIKAYSKIVMPQFIDNMIKIKLQDLTSFYAEVIKQKKTKNMVPLYYYRDILLTKSCSISHHGKYGVFSLLYS